MGIKQEQIYYGFEQGPIRPPSEANSLLIRVSRNCPWNRCTFCSVYKKEKFTLRPVEHVIHDIDQIHQALSVVQQEAQKSGSLTAEQVNQIAEQYYGEGRNVFYTAVNWLMRGEGSVFLQDANSLIIKPDDLAAILNHLMACFPWITRITSYARSHTINRISAEKLRQLATAGLNRIHIGMESASDTVLKKINKGVTKAGHIEAGKLVKAAGIELSEYVMPGMGGTDLSEEHALETADALNQINADFIRLRTLSVPPGIPLYDEYQSGDFNKCTDLEIVQEIRTFVDHLNGITSNLKSDHFYNLLQNVDGKLPEDKRFMLQVIDEFLNLNPEEQLIFQLGRRMGYFQVLSDLHSPAQREHIETIRDRLQATPENIDKIIEEKLQLSI
jgi:uncharacterized Fe-S cluster-containing MiaB family protein